ncbi:DUF5677 domain-containing protein [Streptomyces sp. NPDC054840]
MADLFSEADFTSTPSERGFATQHETQAALHRMLDHLQPVLSRMIEQVAVVGRLFFTNTENKAGQIIANHALNDFRSLLDRLYDGEGRDAARASRSLYEHLVNYCEVMSDDDSAERYLAHRAVTAELLGELSNGLGLLKGSDLKSERSRLYKMKRDSVNELKSALALYGPRFRRDWAKRNLRERAIAHGYGSQYDVYKVLSQVTHGSAGGVLGTFGDVMGAKVHRTGPSLDLAVLAYLEGISFFRDFISEVHDRSALDCREALSEINRAISIWPAYRYALKAVDRALWPVKPPLGPVALIAMYPSGKIRWFCYDPQIKKVKIAIPPEGVEWIEEETRSHLRTSHSCLMMAGEGKPVTAAIHSVPVTPKPGAEWVKQSAYFSDPPLELPGWIKPGE